MCKQPCRECPFKKDSIQGYLGAASHQPEDFLNSMEWNILPCHLQVEWDEADEDEIDRQAIENPCIGALQFLNNSCKLPMLARQKEGQVYNVLMDRFGKNDKVFKWKHEFINHHQ